MAEGRGSFWADYTPEEREQHLKKSFRSPEAIKRAAAGVRRYHANMTDGEKEEWVRRSFHSPEAREKADESIRARFVDMPLEERQRIVRNSMVSPEGIANSAKGRQAHWDSLTPKEKEERLKNSLRCKAANEGKSRYFANLTPEEMQEFRDRDSEAVKAFWDNLTSEERDRRIKKSVLANRPPTLPEKLLGAYLERNFPREWAYNGKDNEGLVIGRKVPDFININGKKEVIEVFGEYWHREDEVEEKIEHYRGFGFGCTIIWDYDCWFPEELDRIFNLKELDTDDLVVEEVAE